MKHRWVQLRDELKFHLCVKRIRGLFAFFHYTRCGRDMIVQDKTGSTVTSTLEEPPQEWKCAKCQLLLIRDRNAYAAAERRNRDSPRGTEIR